MQRAYLARKRSGNWVRQIRKPGENKCSVCGGARTWPEQKQCRKCHREYVRRWRKEALERELRKFWEFY